MPQPASYTGPLDAISSKVLAAFGTVRLFAADAEGLNVRRSSDSTAQDVGTLATGAFDAATFTSFVGGGSGYAVTAYDQKGSADATQATAGTQPQVIANGVGALYAMHFDGTKRLATGSVAGLAVGTGDFEVWLLVKPTNTAAVNDQGMTARGSFAPGFYSRLAASTHVSLYLGGNKPFDTAMVQGTAYVLRFTRRSQVWTLEVNGVADATTYADATNYTAGAIAVGNETAAGGTGFGYNDISFLAYMNTSLTSGEAAALTACLKTLGGIA